MRGWIGRAILVAVGFGPAALRFTQWAFNVVGGIDLFVERIHDPGWIGSVANWIAEVLAYLANMPPWAYPIMIIAATGLLFLDRRTIARRAITPSIQPNDRMPNDASGTQSAVVAINVTTVYGTIGDLVALSAIEVTNVSTSALSGLIVKAESFRAIYKPDASSVVTKKMDDIPSPMVLKTEGQTRNKRGGGFNLRVDESKNLIILWRNKSGKGPRFLVAEDGSRYPVSNSFEVIVGVYGNVAPVRQKLSVNIGSGVETRIEAE